MDNKSTFSRLYLFAAFLGILFLSLTAIIFSLDRYNEFVYGKFDLGNMNQMLYNSSRGNFMIITDYFGNNVPRWAMSHVDPSLLIFVPLNWFYSDANFLLIAQILAFLFSSILVYLIAKKQGISNITSANIALLVFLLPISGFILVWTTFHSLILAMPFLLLAYLLMLNYQKGFSRGRKIIYLVVIYLSFFLVIMSKEEIGLIVFVFGIYLFFKFKDLRKHVVIISILSLFWTFACFLYIIPKYSDIRTEGINQFVNYVGGVDDDNFLNYSGENYFLYRYSDFGDSYSEVAKNLILKPNLTLNLVFSKENIETYNKLFLPVGYLPLASPIIFMAAVPEIAIQVLTGDPTVFSIENHRLLITIPIFLIAIIQFFKFTDKRSKAISLIFSFFLVFLNLVLAYFYKNPLIYPYYDKVFQKVLANSTSPIEFYNDIRKPCAQFIVDDAKAYDYVSSPQPLGAKTSNKKYNALFPAGLDKADYVIADIYARKLVDFMDISTKYNKIAVQKLLETEHVTLQYSCDRFFVLTKSPSPKDLGEITEDTEQNPLLKQNLLDKSYVYGFKFEEVGEEKYRFEYKYKIGDESDRKSLFAYTVLVPTDGGETITFVHFPSFYINTLNDFPVDTHLKETVIYNLPSIYKSTPKKYDVYFGIGNREMNEENVLVGEITL